LPVTLTLPENVAALDATTGTTTCRRQRPSPTLDRVVEAFGRAGGHDAEVARNLWSADGTGSAVLAAERALMDELFSERGRNDPIAVLRLSDVPGCRYDFVRAVLHDPRFKGPAVPPSGDLMFQTVARFLARLAPERHRVVRAHFAGLFTPRRVGQYRERQKYYAL